MPPSSPVTPWLAHERHFDFRRTRVRFFTAWDLFSSASIDVGTARLLRTLSKAPELTREFGRPLRVLDVGCGVGVLGLGIAKSMPCGTVEVVLTDRDKLACAVARHNIALNDLDPAGPQVTALPAGIGYSAARAAKAEPFDLIVSNIPAKVGAEGIGELLFGAGPLLRPGGVVAFVHVTPLTETIDQLRLDFTEFHGPIEVVGESVGKEHRALHWKFPDGLPHQDAGEPLRPWLRADAPTSLTFRGAMPMPHTAVHDVDEFDSLHYRTPLLVQTAQQRLPPTPGEERLCVLNPNHGFLAALLAHRREPASVHLAGRDTLALAVARENLLQTLRAWEYDEAIDVALAPPHRTLPWLPANARETGGYHRIIGHLLWKEGPAAHETTLRTLAAALTEDGAMMLSVGVGQVEGLRRAARRAGLKTSRSDSRRKGHASLVVSRIKAKEDGDEPDEPTLEGDRTD